MQLNIYRQKTTRTLPQLGGLVNDSLHMTVGMMTELTELLSALNNPVLDHVNIKEEIGDYMWYLSNYANIHGLDFLDKNKILEIPKKQVDNSKLSRKIFEDLIIKSGDLLDLDKKKFAYKREYNNSTQVLLFNTCFALISQYCELNDYDLEQIIETNINKLIARYPEKFTENSANNRDLENERKVLENE